MFRRWLLCMIVLLIASGLGSGAFAASENMNELRIGDMLELELSSGTEFSFTPGANGLYGVYVLPGNGDTNARAEILLDGETLAQGDGAGHLVSSRLNAGTQYTLRISGSGEGRLEIARETLSRSFSMPLELDDGEGYSKLIARSGDVHWYSMKVQTSGAALLACGPEEPGLRLQLSLFSADGQRIETSETLASGTAVLSAAFSKGETYFIRVAGSGEGKYSLSCRRSKGTERAQSVELSAREMIIDGRETQRLTAHLYPATACDLIYLDSTAPDVAVAWSSGYVESRNDGETVITVYAYGGARSSCRVTVNPVESQELSLSTDYLIATEGESRSIIATVFPYNATRRQIKWTSGDESIATVDKNGVVTAVSQGDTEITATVEGGFSASAQMTVLAAQPKYRALLVGQQNYAPAVESVREGSEKSVTSINSLLNTFSYTDGGYFEVETRMDGSRDEVLAAVRDVFSGARDMDVSLMYITCHGYYEAGMTFFLMADGSVLSAADLERELRKIPGEIVLLVDCCGSGGVIGRASSAQDILDGVMNVFRGPVGSTVAHGSKYRIIASAHLNQDSYRIGFGEGGMSTVFARALCDAAGWNMDLATPSAFNADVNYDRAITFDELGAYLSKRVTWYLNHAGAYAQTVCVYPEADASILFERINE